MSDQFSGKNSKHRAPNQTLVIGAGFLGKQLLSLIPGSRGTSRTLSKNSGFIHFDLYQEATWNNLPDECQTIIWTFPAASKDETRPYLAERFYQSHLADKSVYIYGSTSCYLTPNSETQPVVDEKTALNLNNPRVACEERLQSLGANLLVLCGIYGKNRSPMQWLLNQKIKNGENHVNLIYEQDILRLTLLALGLNLKGTRINLTPGEHLVWKDIVTIGKGIKTLPKDFAIHLDPTKARKRTVKSIYLNKYFPNFDFTDFVQGISEVEGSSGGSDGT